MQSVQTNQNVGNESELPFMIKLTLPAHNLLNDWKQCSMLANYIAEYVGYQYPQQERAENLISTITNELLEAITSLAPEHSDLTITLQQSAEGLQLDTNHHIHANLASPYLKFLNSLSQPGHEDQYLDMLTTEDTPELYFNQLGLLMLTHDFGATFTNCSTEQTDRVCTQLFIANKEFSA